MKGVITMKGKWRKSKGDLVNYDVLRRINLGALTFYYAAKHQCIREETIGLAAIVGLHQGLKYKGSIKSGITGMIATLVVLGAANGALQVIECWDKIKTA